MIFQTVKEALIRILGNAEAGRYYTYGFNARSQSAESVRDSGRSIMIYYSRGKLNGPLSGPADHSMTFTIELSVSKSAEGNLATIDNPASTDIQRAVALANIQDARSLAEESLDDLIDVIFNILMDNRNIDLGYGAGEIIRNREINEIEIHESIIGGLVVCKAEMKYNGFIKENFTGDKGIAAVSPVMKTTFTVQGDEEATPIAGVDQ